MFCDVCRNEEAAEISYKCEFCGAAVCTDCAWGLWPDWHDTGWGVCSFECQDKAIDALHEECDEAKQRLDNLVAGGK